MKAPVNGYKRQTLVGIFTIAIGVGPRTATEVAFHIAIMVVLAWGLMVTAPARFAVQRA